MLLFIIIQGEVSKLITKLILQKHVFYVKYKAYNVTDSNGSE